MKICVPARVDLINNRAIRRFWAPDGGSDLYVAYEDLCNSFGKGRLMMTTSTERLAGVIEKNTREKLHVSLNEFMGHRLVNLRVWFKAADGQMRPGDSGVALNVGQLDALISALVKARRDASATGWLEPAIRSLPALTDDLEATP